MSLFKKIYANVTPNVDTVILSHDIKRAVTEANVSFGTVLVHVPLGGAGVTLLENDPNLYETYKKWVETQIPATKEPRPNRRSGTGRAFAHLRGKWVGDSLTLPIAEGKLQIGPWQEVIFFDFDDKVGRKEIFILIAGESNEK